MKGLIFNEFLEMVEKKFGYQMVDQIIKDSNLPNDGAYTAVGTYAHSEMVTLVSNLSKYTKTHVPDLLVIFGKYIFKTFTKSYSELVNSYTNAFDFLSHVEEVIHVEVLKLYPEAQLPSIFTNVQSPTEMILIYRSERAMSDLAKGLIHGCLEFYKEKAEIEEIVLKDDKTEVKFTLTMRK